MHSSNQYNIYVPFLFPKFTTTDLNEELATLLLKKQLPQTSVTALQNLLRENSTLKEKNNKLKSLLGRSAKAQRDAKNELGK